MGEMADLALDMVMDFEEERFEFHCGNLSQDEAYERGIIDEQGFEATPFTNANTTTKTCRCCGETKLHWEQVANQWRLFDSNGVHGCPCNPLRK